MVISLPCFLALTLTTKQPGTRGQPWPVSNLSWSYASFLSAIRARTAI